MTRTYRYVARDVAGPLRRGVLLAVDCEVAAAELAARGLYPVTLKEADRVVRHPVPGGVAAAWLRGLATLLDAGLPLDRALSAVTRSSAPEQQQVVQAVQDLVRMGRSLSAAIEEHPETFPPIVAGLVRASERAGQLSSGLDAAATHLETDLQFRRGLRQALAYPGLLALGGIVSTGIIGGVIAPRFVAMLQDYGQSPPFLTVAVIALVRGTAWVMPIVLLLLLGGWIALGRTGRLPLVRAYAVDQVRKLPVAGAIMRHREAVRITRALAGLLRVGLPILPALDAAAQTLTAPLARRAMKAVQERVREGERITAAFRSEAVLPDHLMPLLEMGEEAGRLPDMLARTGDLCAGEADALLGSALRLVEPALIVLFGGVVAATAAGLLQALYSLRPAGP